MSATLSHPLPLLTCRELPVCATGELAAVRQVFQGAEPCVLGQAWLAATEVDFTPATVWTGWRDDSLLIFAELEDVDIFTEATALNERMWELGDTFEIFLQAADAAGYVEFHVTPNNQRLQLKFADAAAVQRAQASNSIEELLVPGEAFRAEAWIQPENGKWFVYAEIPAAAVTGATLPLAGQQWRFSFSRYDYVRGRQEPIISSSSPHAQPSFHRRQEWGTLQFVEAAATLPSSTPTSNL